MTAAQIIFSVSIAGGIIGGMGMGGGTILIPLLTLCAGIEQHLAQSVNLIAFIPMSIAALIVHRKNGYVSFGSAAPVAIFALIGAIGGSFASKYAKGYVMRALFGAFLTVLGVILLVKNISLAVKKIKKINKLKASEHVA